MYNIFRTLIYPSSGACDFAVQLPHRLLCSWFAVCWRFGEAGFEWCPCCRLKHISEKKKASDIKLVFYSSTITMMYGRINIRCITEVARCKTVAAVNSLNYLDDWLKSNSENGCTLVFFSSLCFLYSYWLRSRPVHV